jgi:hypothetical protein
VIGHFSDPSTDPPHFDWLTTGSGFSRADFEAIWERVLDFALGRGATPHRPGPGRDPVASAGPTMA